MTLRESIFWLITFLLTWCMHIYNNDIKPATSHNYIWHPIANKLYSLNHWCYSLVYKISCSQLVIFISFSIEKIIVPALTVSPLSHLTSWTPTKSNFYLANSLVTALSEPALYRLLTFHVPKTMSLFRCLLRGASYRNTPSRRSEWGSSLPPDCFVSRGSISPCEYY